MEDKIWEFIFKHYLRKNYPGNRNDFSFKSVAKDSLLHVKLVLFLEREFKVQIDIEDLDLDLVDTVPKLAKYILEKST